MEQFQSPNEISTLFLVLSISAYVFMFWRSQMPVKPAFQNRRKLGPSPQIHPRRRSTDRTESENMILNQLIENDKDKRSATNH
jgi:hypothetical protein